MSSFGDLFDFKGGSQPPKSTFISEPKQGYIRLLQIRDFKSDKYPAYIQKADKWPDMASPVKNACSYPVGVLHQHDLTHAHV